MNVTLDDNSPQLVYSSEWRVQPPNDPDNENYFQSTYHAVKEDHASMTLSFNGTGIWLYGSKGPSYGRYSVQYTDGEANLLEEYSGYATSIRFQQVLFAKRLGPGIHTIALRNLVGSPDQAYLDLDYVVVQNDAPGLTTTNPGYFPSSAKPKSVEAPTPTISASVTSTQPENQTLFILSIFFGCICGVGLLGLLFFLFRRHCYRSRQSVSSVPGTPEDDSLYYAPSTAATIVTRASRHTRAKGASPGAGSRQDTFVRGEDTEKRESDRKELQTPNPDIAAYLRGERGREYIPKLVAQHSKETSPPSSPTRQLIRSASTSSTGERALSPRPVHRQRSTRHPTLAQQQADIAAQVARRSSQLDPDFSPTRSPPAIPSNERPFSTGYPPEAFLASPVPKDKPSSSQAQDQVGVSTRHGHEKPRAPLLATLRERSETLPRISADAIPSRITDEERSFTPDEKSFTGGSKSRNLLRTDGLRTFFKGP